MGNQVGLLLLVLLLQLLTFIAVWNLMRELRLLSSVVERIKVWTSKRKR